ncbi:MAG: SCP2 sterol-binding domain-containing protein [Alphaproteobacteria bacterium]|nr:SCP2 sterol-binding domain-containing protein [Alphaproteobacteria bacterium]
MPNPSLSPSFARTTLNALPGTALQHALNALLRRMRQKHSKLFANLRRLDPAVVVVEPTDTQHRFLLTFGGNDAALTVLDAPPAASDAAIKGKLSVLLDMLEGRTDGDTVFFSRDLEITGNTAVIVALRNTLDREEINVLNDAASMFGPYAGPIREAVLLIDAVAQHLRHRIDQREKERAFAR